MREIKLKEAIEQFGFKTGFSFWFRWSFISPVEKFVWLNITHKPYCEYAGYHCREENCEHKHFTEKKDILAIWEKGHREMERVESGKDGTCVYCGEEKGTIKIPNPNSSEINQWLVCETCDEVIELQRESSFPIISQERHQEINNRLLEISKQTGKPIMNMELNKEVDGYKASSIIFTGEEK